METRTLNKYQKCFESFEEAVDFVKRNMDMRAGLRELDFHIERMGDNVWGVKIFRICDGKLENKRVEELSDMIGELFD